MIAALMLSLAWLAGPPQDAHGHGHAGLTPAEHPHDPWVFRSVLDGAPRMLTLAFRPDLWLAFDATDCRLVKAWAGEVAFEGAVYTTEHGPQPESRGWSYLEGLEAAWELVREDGRSLGTPRWLGYRLGDEQVTLRYELVFPGGERISVDETVGLSPEARPYPEPRMDLVRSFRFGPLPEDAELFWTVVERTAAPTFASRRWGGERVRAEEAGDVQRFELFAPGGTTELWCQLLPAEPSRIEAALAADEPAEHEPEPAVEATPAAAGLRPLPDVEATRQDPVHGPLRPGVALKLYEVDTGLDRIPDLIAGQTPNVSVVLPRIELRGGRGDFQGLEDHFVAVLAGYLEVPHDGLWGLGLESDDGSRLWLDHGLVVDHDGLHSSWLQEAEVELEAGLHPFSVRYFENEWDAELVLRWRAPGSETWEVVPDAAFLCRAGEVRVTSPGPKRIVRPLERGGPGDGRPLEGVHPSFDLARVRPADFEPRVGGLAFGSDGTLFVATWDADGAVYALEGVQGDDPEAVRVRRVAAGLAEPLGLCVVDERLFCLQKQELTELIDADGDGLTDEYRCVSAGWGVSPNFHEFAFGLAHHDGRFWANLAIAIEPGGASSPGQHPDRGTVVAIDPVSGDYEVVARGLRTPNGIGRGAGDALYVTDNQGDWVPVSKLVRVVEGAFYGNRSVLLDDAEGLPVTPPVCWLPQGEIGNSPSEPVAIPDGVGPWTGQMLHGEVTHGGVKRVFVEEVDGVLQGTVFRFTQGLEAGINRLAWGPDGALYLGGVGSTGNWSQSGKLWFGLERLRYNGRPVFEPLALRTRTNGLELELTEPLAEGLGWEPWAFTLESWRYEATGDYGGPKLDRRRHAVLSSSPSEDRRRVFLELADLEPERVFHLQLFGLESADGRRPWTTESWTTVNRIPSDRPGAVRTPPPAPPANVLTDAERAAGWELLFDGTTTAGWSGFRRDDVPAGWRVEDGALARLGPGGDLVTREVFEDFELMLDWRISHGGNSGVFFHVSDEHDHVWQSGPEMQVLDNREHPDGQSALTSAGANYALHAPTEDTTAPVGAWNRARIKVEGGRVEHWLNGEKLLEYELGSADWEARVGGSKFASMPGYGRAGRGRIALQDHGDPVWYRNVRIRRLDG